MGSCEIFKAREGLDPFSASERPLGLLCAQWSEESKAGVRESCRGPTVAGLRPGLGDPGLRRHCGDLQREASPWHLMGMFCEGGEEPRLMPRSLAQWP